MEVTGLKADVERMFLPAHTPLSVTVTTVAKSGKISVISHRDLAFDILVERQVAPAELEPLQNALHNLEALVDSGASFVDGEVEIPPDLFRGQYGLRYGGLDISWDSKDKPVVELEEVLRIINALTRWA